MNSRDLSVVYNISTVLIIFFGLVGCTGGGGGGLPAVVVMLMLVE